MSNSKWDGTPFKRGARRTPHHRLMAIPRFVPKKAALAQVAMVPTKLSMWGNSTYGDCVSASEAFAKGAWSVFCGLADLFVPEAEVERWAQQYGFLNGADLSQVMDQMAQDGFNVDGVNYKDGPHHVVDYSNEPELQAALCTGPVKFALDANALPSGAGTASGWVGQGGSPGQYPNSDHAMEFCGYGPAAWLSQQIGVSLPSGLDPTSPMYLAFTWSTIGLVDHNWIMSTVSESHVRTPTTPGQIPPAGDIDIYI